MDSIIIDTGTSIINLNGQTYKICYYGSLNAICEISEIFIKDISAREKTIYLIHALLCGDKEKNLAYRNYIQFQIMILSIH